MQGFTVLTKRHVSPRVDWTPSNGMFRRTRNLHWRRKRDLLYFSVKKARLWKKNQTQSREKLCYFLMHFSFITHKEHYFLCIHSHWGGLKQDAIFNNFMSKILYFYANWLTDLRDYVGLKDEVHVKFKHVYLAWTWSLQPEVVALIW
jgi:hypothetical protein